MSSASAAAPEKERCITPAGYWSIGVWFQMAGMLGAQCGAQHSQVDNNGNTQRHRCPYEEPNVCESVFICEPMSMCKYVFCAYSICSRTAALHALVCVADLMAACMACLCVCLY